MASSSSTPTMEFESESKRIRPNWLELPTYVTTNILQRLSMIELVTCASRVCPLWWNICKDPLMWRTIRMPSIPNSPYNDVDMLKICCNAVQRSCNHLEDIDIEYFGTDELLRCIANNGSHLRCMRLEECSKISDYVFCEAVRKLPHLEKVDISFCKLADYSLEALGRSCPLLKSLKYENLGSLFHRRDATAFSIAETMSGLCHLNISGHNLTNVGLHVILDNCPLLKSLDIRRCEYLELSESLKKRCIDQINDYNYDGDYYDDDDSDWNYTLSDDDYDPYF